ncbi:MAG TPA: hypothetical protein VFI25_12370 [Planctomycetota bacterium]|jgi:hypothetical protein|nr:hypothetical protein [Planctomycetota bacterium]
MRSSERWIVYPGLLMLGGFTFARQETRPAAPDAEFGDLKVRSLVVSAPDGKGSVEIKVGGDGRALVQVMGPDGGWRSALGISSNGASGLFLRKKNGEPGGMLALNSEDLPRLDLCGKDGKLGAVLRVDATGSPSLVLSDKDGEVRAGLAVAPEGWSSFNLYGREGGGAAALSVESDGWPNLSLFRKNGPAETRSETVLVVTSQGPQLSLSMAGVDRAVLGCAAIEKTRTGAVEQTGPSSLVLFDKEGKVIFRAP